MTTHEKLTALAERCEKGFSGGPAKEEQSRLRLNGDIAVAQGLWAPVVTKRGGEWARDRWFFNSGMLAYQAPDFGGSIDAAASLVPEGWVWAVRRGVSTSYAEMADEPFIETAHEKGSGVDAVAASPALALCAAALRAQAAETRDANG